MRPHLEEIIMAVIVAQEDLPQAPAEDELASSNDLLHQMLPPHVAAALREGRKVQTPRSPPPAISFGTHSRCSMRNTAPPALNPACISWV